MMSPPPKPPFAEEIQLIKQYVNKDSIVLDIGANVGSFTIFLASIAKKVYAFEPSCNNFKALRQNTHIIENILIYNAAISNKQGTAHLHICPNDNGMNRLYPSKWCEGGDVENVCTWRIDNIVKLIKTDDDNKISFVKMDIEGYEYHAIKGMVKTIKRDHPVIMMEWHPPSLEEAKTDPREFYNFMINDLKYDLPRHVLLNKVINTYEELDNYTRNTPAINILWMPTRK